MIMRSQLTMNTDTQIHVFLATLSSVVAKRSYRVYLVRKYESYVRYLLKAWREDRIKSETKADADPETEDERREHEDEMMMRACENPYRMSMIQDGDRMDEVVRRRLAVWGTHRVDEIACRRIHRVFMYGKDKTKAGERQRVMLEAIIHAVPIKYHIPGVRESYTY